MKDAEITVSHVLDIFKNNDLHLFCGQISIDFSQQFARNLVKMAEHVTEGTAAHVQPDTGVAGAIRKSNGSCAAENVKMAGSVVGDAVDVNLGSLDLDAKEGTVHVFGF